MHGNAKLLVNIWRAKRVLPEELDGQFCIAVHVHILLHVGVYLNIFLPYVHKPESTWKILQTQLDRK